MTDTTQPPDWAAFGKEVMEAWPEGDVDGFTLQDLAIKHHVLLPVDGGFNPEIHTDDYGWAEPGDDWYVRNNAIPDQLAAQEELRTLRAQVDRLRGERDKALKDLDAAMLCRPSAAVVIGGSEPDPFLCECGLSGMCLDPGCRSPLLRTATTDKEGA